MASVLTTLNTLEINGTFQALFEIKLETTKQPLCASNSDVDLEFAREGSQASNQIEVLISDPIHQ